MYTLVAKAANRRSMKLCRSVSGRAGGILRRAAASLATDTGMQYSMHSPPLTLHVSTCTQRVPHLNESLLLVDHLL